ASRYTAGRSAAGGGAACGGAACGGAASGTATCGVVIGHRIRATTRGESQRQKECGYPFGAFHVFPLSRAYGLDLAASVRRGPLDEHAVPVVDVGIAVGVIGAGVVVAVEIDLVVEDDAALERSARQGGAGEQLAYLSIDAGGAIAVDDHRLSISGDS